MPTKQELEVFSRAVKFSKLALALAKELARYDGGNFHSRLEYLHGDWRCKYCEWRGDDVIHWCSECVLKTQLEHTRKT